MRRPSVLSNSGKFGFVHHKKLNSSQTLQTLSSIQTRYPGFIHIAEGDLCWYFKNGREELYFWHPKYVIDSLSEREIDKAKEKGNFFSLEDAIHQIDPNLRYIIELKIGVGDETKALSKLATLLTEHFDDKYWVDTFSLRLLRKLKIQNSSIPTSLHTKFVASRFVAKSALEYVPISIHELENLDYVDIITLSYNTSIASFSNLDVDNLCKSVYSTDKNLVLGGLKTPAMFEIAQQSSALAGYAKFPIEQLSP